MDNDNNKIPKTEEDYCELYYNGIINNIYDFIQENSKKDLIELFLGEVDDSQLELYFFALEKLKKEKIITGYRTKQEDITEPLEREEEITVANLKYDLELYIDRIDSKNNTLDGYPPSEHHLIYALIDKSDVNQPALRKLVTNKKYIEELELLLDGKKITVFINKNYSNPVKINDSARGNSYWNRLCELAQNRAVKGDNSIIKYFNYNKNNPIYSRGLYKTTDILRKNYELLEKTIPISVTTKTKINRSLGQMKRKK